MCQRPGPSSLHRTIKAIGIPLSSAWLLIPASSTTWRKKSFQNPFFGWLIRQFGTFPVKRGSVDRAAVRQAIKEIKEGNPLGIFPEGTRIKREGLGRFHTGMASLALMTGTPVIPVAVLGTMDLPRKNGPLAVLIGKPIEVKKQRPTDEKVAELNDIVKAEIQKLMDDYKK